MHTTFNSPYSNSAAGLLAQEIGVHFAPLEIMEDKSAPKVSHKKLTSSAHSLYEQMMKFSAKELFEVLEKTSIKAPGKKSMRQYSACVKALTICQVYLLVVDNGRAKNAPSWLVSYLLEALQLGDQIEMEPSSTEIIMRYGAQRRREFIEGLVGIALSYLPCHDDHAKKELVRKINDGNKERFQMLKQALRQTA